MLGLLNFAQANGSNQAEPSSGMAAGLVLFFIALGTVNLVFFVLALIHLIKNPSVPNRTLWIVLVILFGGLPGGLIYYFGPRRSFEKASQSGAPAANSGQSPQYQGAPPASPAQAQTPLGAPIGATIERPVSAPDAASATPVDPPTVAEAQPQVAAAPENPIQVPPNPDFSAASTFEPSQPPQDVPTAPPVSDESGNPPSQEEVVPAPSEDENSNWQNPNNQA